MLMVNDCEENCKYEQNITGLLALANHTNKKNMYVSLSAEAAVKIDFGNKMLSDMFT